MDHTVPLMSTRFLTPVKPVYSCPCAIELLQLSLDFFGYMPRGPNVATSLCIVSNAKQDLSYFCMWACCTFLKRLARLAGHLANA